MGGNVYECDKYCRLGVWDSFEATEFDHII